MLVITTLDGMVVMNQNLALLARTVETTYRGYALMKNRGQKVKLENKENGQVVKAVVILSDSKQGYLASTPTGIPDEFHWEWYNLNNWREVK